MWENNCFLRLSDKAEDYNLKNIEINKVANLFYNTRERQCFHIYPTSYIISKDLVSAILHY